MFAVIMHRHSPFLVVVANEMWFVTDQEAPDAGARFLRN
jgi:hypothetical protein